MIPDTRIFNSLSRKKEKLIPRQEGRLTFYSCGPTVYNLIHVGNLRSALVSDMFYRYWNYLGFDVIYARNYTDIDDKILNKAKEESVDASAISEKYIKEVEKDYREAGVLEPTYKPKVTDNLESIFELTQDILSRGGAYQVGGNIVFSVDAFDDYGKLSGKPLDQLMSGARVEVDEKKKNPLDFYLWKEAAEDQPGWDSPWGRGRPGWHIECSAMIRKYLGDQIDVHHGGVDLVFPHHENELAQSEKGCDRAPFVRYWMHHAFVTINEEKMSKSLGNIFSAREFLENFGGEMARYLMLTPHYRSPIDFSENSLWTAACGLERIYEAKKTATECVACSSSIGELSSEFEKAVEESREKIKAALADDFHTPGVVASFFDLIRDYNKVAYQGTDADKRANANMFLKCLEAEMADILGVGLKAPEVALEELAEIKKRIKGVEAGADTKCELSASDIDSLLKERDEARKRKNFARADEIRDQLYEAGVDIKDTPLGAKWSYR